MLQKVEPGRAVKAKDFLQLLDLKQRKKLVAYAREMEKRKVMHVSAVAQGGGVAELLHSLVPYMRALGVDASWYAIDAKKAGNAFFDFTNRLHNSLQGSLRKFSREEWRRYEEVNKEIAEDMDKADYDILVVHDPQPLAAGVFGKKEKPKMCAIHIDTSMPDPVAWKKVSKLARQYDAIIFSNEMFVNKSLPKEKIHVFEPAIDPLASKQALVPLKKAREYLSAFGVAPKGRLVVQVSRFDVWKNPHGLVEAFRLLEKKHLNAVLLLVGFQEARDNPESEKVYMDIRAMVGKDPRIFLFFNPRRIGGASNIQEFTVMAQNAADIVVQNSIKEGFGLTVAEAMWKEKPVIGGPALGVRRQIRNGENGYIAQSTKQLVHALADLLGDAEKRKAFGKVGRESVRRNFLMPRFVLDHLRVYVNMLH